MERPVKSVMSVLTAFSLLASGFMSASVASDTVQPLVSPWDRTVSKVSSTSHPCAALPVLPQSFTVTGYYVDKNHSVIDPERMKRYKAATKELYDAAKVVTKLADQYQQQGRGDAASCASKGLAGLAQSNSLTSAMQGNQARYVQGWVLGAFSIAWLKIRTDPGITSANRKLISDWLASIATQNRQYYDQRPKAEDARNNHRYWAGLAVTAAGIAANRRDLFDWGIESERIGLRQVRPDGSLPLEMNRRAKALHYHLFAAAPLVVTAELASANGIDLYQEEDAALPRLVRFALSGITNPAPFEKASGIQQEPVDITASSLGWVIPFERRFPDPAIKSMVEKSRSKTMLYLGGLPPE